MKWNVSVLRRSGECERIEVADFELSEFFNRIASVEGSPSNRGTYIFGYYDRIYT